VSPLNALPSPRGPRFQIVQFWPIYGPCSEIQGSQSRVVATAYTYKFAVHLVGVLWPEFAGDDADLDIRDLRPDPAPAYATADPHPVNCHCTECEELPF
jgi:hypothetical protein